MEISKIAEKIGFGVFVLVLIGNIIATVIILGGIIGIIEKEEIVAKASALMPIIWLLAVVSLGQAFRYLNVKNRKNYDWLVQSKLYYYLLALTLSLFSVYTLYAYWLCNRERNWVHGLYIILSMVPVINFCVMYKIVNRRVGNIELLRLYLAFSLSRFIYLHYRS